jgi:hypothetical protein
MGQPQGCDFAAINRKTVGLIPPDSIFGNDRQPGPYIRSSELCSIVEGAHGNVARKTKWWLEHEIPHARGNS